jgi:hypothetical protein
VAAADSDETSKQAWDLRDRVGRLSQVLELNAIVLRAHHIQNGMDPSLSRALVAAEEQLGRPFASLSGDAEAIVQEDAEQMRSVITWFPIETAPRNEQHVLLGCEETTGEGWYDAGYGWCSDQDTPWPYSPPTHFAYLPDLPRRKGTSS